MLAHLKIDTFAPSVYCVHACGCCWHTQALKGKQSPEPFHLLADAASTIHQDGFSELKENSLMYLLHVEQANVWTIIVELSLACSQKILLRRINIYLEVDMNHNLWLLLLSQRDLTIRHVLKQARMVSETAPFFWLQKWFCIAWLQFEESHPFCNECHSLTFSLVKQIVLKIAATNDSLFVFLQLFLHFNKFTGHALQKCGGKKYVLDFRETWFLWHSYAVNSPLLAWQ